MIFRCFGSDDSYRNAQSIAAERKIVNDKLWEEYNVPPDDVRPFRRFTVFSLNSLHFCPHCELYSI